MSKRSGLNQPWLETAVCWKREEVSAMLITHCIRLTVGKGSYNIGIAQMAEANNTIAITLPCKQPKTSSRPPFSFPHNWPSSLTAPCVPYM